MATEETTTKKEEEEAPSVLGVYVPMSPNKGPYPCIKLRFPTVNPTATFDFLLDTGSDAINLHAGVVEQYGKQQNNSNIKVAYPGDNLVNRIGGNLFNPGDVYDIGDCELVGMESEGGGDEPFTLMSNVRSSGFACPEHAVWEGRFGVPFLAAYPAVVAFEWHETADTPPTVIFFLGEVPPETDEMKLVPLIRLPTDLLSIPITVNGVALRAILDTGSDKTTLTPEAAAYVGIDLEAAGGNDDDMARSVSPVSIYAGEVPLGEGPIYVKEMPKLANLLGLITEQGLDPSYLPHAILGLDFLRQSYRMMVRVQSGEVWFEELLD